MTKDSSNTGELQATSTTQQIKTGSSSSQIQIEGKTASIWEARKQARSAARAATHRDQQAHELLQNTMPQVPATNFTPGLTRTLLQPYQPMSLPKRRPFKQTQWEQHGRDITSTPPELDDAQAHGSPHAQAGGTQQTQQHAANVIGTVSEHFREHWVSPQDLKICTKGIAIGELWHETQGLRRETLEW